MNSKDEAQEFLMSRRAQITPAQVGLPDYGEERRVPGLRREEVASLAGVSLGYYTRLERGDVGGASESVLGAIATALRLTEARTTEGCSLGGERALSSARLAPTPCRQHQRARDRADAAPGPGCGERPQPGAVLPGLRGPARGELRAVQLPRSARPGLLRRLAAGAAAGAAILRLEAGRNPLNEELTALIGELSTISPYFREDWARRDVGV
ncbi:helix-turn-helix domain-containing protein [Arthrobacter sp. ISL-5]|nr:helix-turn-helix transcriptional regulator [Arthrobacter sp. ISL-5]MBT2555472.1 helix-turn-helix domain-containing protein [Arthrobacter sp. ISL-5]